MKALAAMLLACVPMVCQSVTFSKDVAPILSHYCASCHQPGEAAPFSLLTYDDARQHAKQIARVTEQRYMPPWLPVPGHGDFAGSLRLSDAQIAVLSRWVREGMAPGDASVPPLARVNGGWQLGEPDLIVKMRAPYRLAATGTDVFRNFVLTTGLKETKYIRAFELRPGNKRVVHHANLIVDRSRSLRKRDGQDGQPGFPGMDIQTEVAGDFDPDSHFLFWKPGSPAQEEPADMAWRLGKDSDLILNMHLRPSGKPEDIEAVVGLYFAKHEPTRHPMLLQLEHDGAIDIPAGSKTFAVTDKLKLPIAVNLLAIYPHAHYLGKQIDAWAELPSGVRQPLIKIDNWDINWQATYTYKQPVSLPAGTTVAMRIGYDNTTENPRNPSNPPKRVRTGNRSEDEMGHVWLQVVPSALADEDPRLVLQQAVMRRRLEKYPGDFVALFNLGAALEAEGKPSDALPYLTEAARAQPSSAMARNNLAVALFSLERLPDAEKEFRAALAIDPDYQNARYNLARALAAQGESEAALKELLVHLSANPDDAGAHEFAGRLLAGAGKFADSVPHFRKAAELEPDNTSFLTNLGAALASAGDSMSAIPVFEKVLNLDPANAAAKDNLARARRRLEGKKF